MWKQYQQWNEPLVTLVRWVIMIQITTTVVMLGTGCEEKQELNWIVSVATAWLLLMEE